MYDLTRRCGKLIGGHNYTVHIIRHTFADMKDYESENVRAHL